MKKRIIAVLISVTAATGMAAGTVMASAAPAAVVASGSHVKPDYLLHG